MFSGLFSPTHLMIVVGVGVLLFGRGAVQGWGQMIGSGIKDFYKGMKEIKGVGDTATKELTDCRDSVTKEATGIRDNISRIG